MLATILLALAEAPQPAARYHFLYLDSSPYFDE